MTYCQDPVSHRLYHAMDIICPCAEDLTISASLELAIFEHFGDAVWNIFLPGVIPTHTQYEWIWNKRQQLKNKENKQQ